MHLTDEEKRMYNGEYGPGVQKCMDLLVRFGDAFGAEKMEKVNFAHISTNIPNAYLEEMTAGATQGRTLCSLHAVFDPGHWREAYGLVAKPGETIAGGLTTVDENEFKPRLKRLLELGFLPTFTCAPYLIGTVPRQGQVFIATGSSGQVFCNSILAARANREGMPSALASAITGLTPSTGFMLKENRYAQVVINVENADVEKWSTADYGALGYFIGALAGVRNAAIVGLPKQLSAEQCKLLMSPLPVSGACTLCHIVGVTPEAPTLEIALGNKKPEQTAVFSKKELKETYGKLNSAVDTAVDLVVLGCPHLSIWELQEVASLLGNKKVKKNVKLMIGASRPVHTFAKDAGYADVIEKAGGFFENSCASLLNPLLFLGGGSRVTATNSARAAHYMVRLTGGKTKVFYGDAASCIRAAITGKWGG